MLETGVIQTVSQPRMPQFTPNPQNPYQYPQPMVVDIVANVGQDRRNLNGLPADNDIFDYNGNVVISLDKDKIANEIKVLYKEQEGIYNSHDRAKELMGIYSGMLSSLNPEDAEKKAQAEEIASLKNTVAQLTQLMQRQTEQFQQFMNQGPASSNSKPSKNKE